MERAGNVRRRDHDGEGFGARPLGAKQAARFPMGIPARLDGGGVEGLVDRHGRRVLAAGCDAGKLAYKARPVIRAISFSTSDSTSAGRRESSHSLSIGRSMSRTRPSSVLSPFCSGFTTSAESAASAWRLATAAFSETVRGGIGGAGSSKADSLVGSMLCV